MKGRVPRKLIGAVVVVVVVAIVAYLLLSYLKGGVISISGPTNLRLTHNPLIVRVSGSEYEFSLVGIAPSAGPANIYLYSLPVFSGQAYNVTLDMNSTTHVNIGTKYANVGILMYQASGNSIGVTIFPIAEYSNTQADSYNIKTIPEELLLGMHGAGGLTGGVTSTTVASTTTIAQSHSSTTSIAVNATLQKIIQIENANQYYPLLLNYSKLYKSETNCSAASYSSAYISLHGFAPAGQFTYANVTYQTPYALTYNTTGAGKNLYDVTFYGGIRISYLNGVPAATIKVNTSASTSSATLSGIFAGLNYTTLKNNYLNAITFANGCGAYLAVS